MAIIKTEFVLQPNDRVVFIKECKVSGMIITKGTVAVLKGVTNDRAQILAHVVFVNGIDVVIDSSYIIKLDISNNELEWLKYPNDMTIEYPKLTRTPMSIEE